MSDEEMVMATRHSALISAAVKAQGMDMSRTGRESVNRRK